MADVLVTGAAGFIGSHVCDHLIGAGHSVVALDDLSGGFLENVSAEAEFIQGSVSDSEFVRSLFAERNFEYIFHLAAYAAEGLSHFVRRFNYTNNLLGSINVINECVRSGEVKCLVFTSSIAVYGSGQVPMSEDMTPEPEDPYGISKYAVELDLKAAHEMFGLNYVIFRPHNVYGSRQNISDPYRNVIGIFLNQAMQDKPLTVFGDGTQTRAFSHVDDVAPAIAASIEKPETYQQVYNIGADKAHSVNKLVGLVAAAFGKELQVEHLPSRNEVDHAWASHDKVKAVLGDMMPGIELEDGIPQMAEWARCVGPRPCTSFGNIELDRKLPGKWRSLSDSNIGSGGQA